jgi:hypothetical protein
MRYSHLAVESFGMRLYAKYLKRKKQLNLTAREELVLLNPVN